jgi:hypothetical protein
MLDSDLIAEKQELHSKWVTNILTWIHYRKKLLTSSNCNFISLFLKTKDKHKDPIFSLSKNVISSKEASAA